MSSLLRRNPTKIIPFILVSVLSAASACYAADPTLDGGHISSGAPTHGVVLHLHGCDGLVRSGVIGEWLSRLQQMGFSAPGRAAAAPGSASRGTLPEPLASAPSRRVPPRRFDPDRPVET